MSEHELRGLAAAGGVAVGRVLVLDDAEPAGAAVFAGHVAERARALAMLEAEAHDLAARADRLRAQGLPAEAEILEANRMMASDPLLREEVARLTAELSAAPALRRAADRHAELLAGLADPMLAARAADVRELGRRAARRVAGSPVRLGGGGGPFVLVARDLGPADVAELRDAENGVVGLALVAGATTSHAAIMARSLGLPMAVALGEGLLRAVEGEAVVLDGDHGVAYLAPDAETEAWGRQEMERLARARRALAAGRTLPPVTRDGHWVSLLCNASTAVEIRAGLDAEADGIGLLRTELVFLEAEAWPTEAEHLEALEPLLALLDGHVATVRVLDFGADKTPPFLAGTDRRGLALLLEHPDALAAQLRAILRAAGGARLRIMLPLVETAAQLRAARGLLREAAAATGWRRELPRLGAMVETPEGACHASDLALEADFLSIGTNDLVQYTLGLDRLEPLATLRSAAEPEVLRHVASTAAAGRGAGLTVEVCGEAASVPPLAVLLLGLGVNELSVAPARLDEIRAAVRGLDLAEATTTARAALDARSGAEALALGERLVLGELGDEGGQVLDGLGGIVA